MSGLYEIKPKDSYVIKRECAKCNTKTSFINTHCFRVNANGNELDVWLIYQCEKCKHTYNLPILERVRPDTIPQNTYKKFLANDRDLAITYGNDKALFEKHHAEIDLSEETYEIKPVQKEKKSGEIVIDNPYDMKIRVDKVLAEILDLSRSKVQKMLADGQLACEHHYLEEHTVIKSAS